LLRHVRWYLLLLHLRRLVNRNSSEILHERWWLHEALATHLRRSKSARKSWCHREGLIMRHLLLRLAWLLLYLLHSLMSGILNHLLKVSCLVRFVLR
jgi:hypothetical protein